MIQQGMVFGGEGPIMQGTWYNPQTGDAFTVRDSFFEDNQYVVTTTDGRYLNYNQLQNYIQSDMKLEDLKKMKNESSKKETALPAEVANLIEEYGGDPYASMMTDDDLMIGHNKPVSLGNLNDNSNKYVSLNEPKTPLEGPVKQTDMNVACIEKALKNTPMPKFNIKLEWKDYPTKNIEMLKDIMDIPMEEILDWYLEKIDMLDIAENIRDIMKKHILRDIKEEIVPVSPALTKEELKENTEKVKKTRKTTTTTKKS